MAENDPIVIQARAALARLVADGTIEQAEADVVMQGVIAGRVDEGALVRAGDVSAAHMSTIRDALIEVKRANAPDDGGIMVPEWTIAEAAEHVRSLAAAQQPSGAAGQANAT